MIKILKFLCLLIGMLISFLGFSSEFGRGGVDAISRANAGLDVFIRLLLDPVALFCFSGVVCGGLLFGYGHDAFRPWFRLIFGVSNGDDFAPARANAILKTAEQLLIITGITLCFVRLVATMSVIDRGYYVVANSVAKSFFCIVLTGLISLFVIVPVKAYWKNQSLLEGK